MPESRLPGRGTAGHSLPSRGLSLLRIALWVIVFLAIYGVAQYVRDLLALHQLSALRANGFAGHRLLWALGFDVLALLTAAALALSALATLLYAQAGASHALGALCLLMALWWLIVLAWAAGHWPDFAAIEAARGTRVAAQSERAYLVGLAVKMCGIPLLLWVAWRLRASRTRVPRGLSDQGLSD